MNPLTKARKGLLRLTRAKARRAFLRLFRFRRREAPRIEIGRALWEEMCAELARRGGGRRESGAFLLADPRNGPRRVQRVAYYDDLDPGSLTGNIRFRAAGYAKLWDICDEEGLRVIGDVHTHPSGRVGQSATDRGNPMIARDGHVAIVMPDYAARPVAARDAGVHEYHGDRGWESRFGAAAERALRIG